MLKVRGYSICGRSLIYGTNRNGRQLSSPYYPHNQLKRPNIKSKPFQYSQTFFSTTSTIENNIPHTNVNNEIQSKTYSETQEEKDYEKIELDFENGELAYSHKSNLELIRSLIVFQLCRKKFFLKSASLLLNIFGENEVGTFGSLRNRLLQPILSKMIKKTIFTQFMGGENEKEILATTSLLHDLSVSSLLDYSIESPALSHKPNPPPPQLPPPIKCEVISPPPSPSSTLPSSSNETKTIQNRSNLCRRRKERKIVKTIRPVCDQYFYSFDSEAYFDKNADDKIKSIGESANCNTNTVPFIAIKMSGVMGSDYLKELSNNLNVMESQFNQFKNKTDLTAGEFHEYLTQIHNLSISQEDSLLFFNQIAKHNSAETINFLTFIDYFDIQSDLIFTPESENKQPKDRFKLLLRSVNFPLQAGNQSNYSLFHSHYPRLLKICTISSHLNVRILMDAEQTYLQPAINLLTLKLEEMFNKEIPIVYNTYQCYLKITPSRIQQSYDRASRLGYIMGAKIVRGAYLTSEMKDSAHLFCSSIEETHENYNNTIPYLFDNLSKRDNLSIVFATHNQNSVLKVLQHYRKYKVDPKENKIFFANLLGMSDNLTFILAQNKFPVMKVVPYGPLPIVLPYLIRRAQENSAILLNSRNESEILYKELKRRFNSSHFINKPGTK